ncbi:MAG: tRNA lysidine(34) synthetase TilS, partial [Proteobacteria bacterium]|nr:tRNA lysidine(34) synthetase TilS [Pseudomonadota bacterium]
MPLSDDEFAALMAPFTPFEAAPTIAVAVSGGRDSMSLALLAARWAARCGGELVAVTIDHGLRPDSAREAKQVAGWLGAHNIRHRVLRWQGPYPSSGIQAAARQARYRLLTQYCREHSILHLLVGHHREDQAETVLIRRERASGRDGLAAMARLSEQSHLRLLRPLLEVPRARLSATLEVAGQSWIDDPSNDNTQMARGRMRAQGDELSLADALATAQISARERIAAEGATAGLAARALRFHPAGFITLDRAILAAEPAALVERVLARAVMAVAGRRYPPRTKRSRRLREAMMRTARFPGHTLAGGRLIGHENVVYVCREAARIGPPVGLTAGASTVWDNRFTASVTKSLDDRIQLGALTASGWNQIVKVAPQLRDTAIPYGARTVSPAIWRDDAVLAVPHLGYAVAENLLATAGFQLKWRPPLAVAPARFG